MLHPSLKVIVMNSKISFIGLPSKFKLTYFIKSNGITKLTYIYTSHCL